MPSKKNRTNKADRAKLFQPFDSLKGFNKYIREKERVIIEMKELSTDDCDELNWKINQIKVGKKTCVVYYDENKYIKLEGMVSKIDLENEKILQIVKTKIPLSNIIKITGEQFDETD